MTDEPNLFETLQTKAARGDLEAMYEIGWRSIIGLGLPQDEATGLEYLRRAAEMGHSLAQNNLGARYASGDGVPVDLVQAYCWFSRAAAQGDRKAGKNRDSVAGQMSPEQRAEAETKLSRASLNPAARQTP